MGQLSAFDLDAAIEDGGLVNYVETGTGEGISLAYAQHKFKDLHSIDIDADLIQAALNRFQGDGSIHLYVGLSRDMLPVVLGELSIEPTLFFLDAHFPGADFHKITYEESMARYQEDAFPLVEELKIITSGRNTSRDVFIIDDFSLYEDGDWEAYAWQYKELQGELGLATNSNEIYPILSDTHVFSIYTAHQGYLVAVPK